MQRFLCSLARAGTHSIPKKHYIRHQIYHMTIKLPSARNRESGDICSAAKASKGDNWECPQCRQSVILKKGSIRTPHFAHEANYICAGMTALHKRCIQLVTNNTDRRICLESGSWFPYTAAQPEADLGRRRIDVMLRGQNGRRLAVEICVTHPLTPAKISDLGAAGVSSLGNQGSAFRPPNDR